MIYSSELEIPQLKNNPKYAKKFFEDNGFLVERDNFGHKVFKEILESTYSLSNFKNKIYKPLMMPHKNNKFIMNLMKDKKMLKYMNLLIGNTENKIFGLQSEFFYGSPGTTGFSMHQDSFYTEPSISNAFGSAWIPMVDLDENMGNLIIYKKSHLKGKLPVKKINQQKDINQDPNANNEETILNCDEFEKILIKEKKGSIVFIHADLVHSSLKNKTNKFRSVLLLTYIRSDCNFRPGKNAKRELIPLS